MPRVRLRGVIAAAAVLWAVAWLAGQAWSAGRLPVASPIVVTRAFVDVADTVRRNETMSDVFGRQNITGGEFLAVLARMDGINPRRLLPNTVFEFRYAVGRDMPERVRVRLSDSLFLRVDRHPSGDWRSTSEEVAWALHTERVAGAITSSLNDAILGAVGDSLLPRDERHRLIWDLADGVFAWQIDFTRDIYPGDRFTVLYERLVSSLGEVRYGRVLAAVIESRGSANSAYVLTDAEGRNAYYDDRGRSLRRAFKMYPVQYRRISSNFSRGRLHPVLRTRRAHLGTDYAAVPGTPIEATGDGTVTRAGRWGGYGIMVSLRHPRDIETRYAHMSRVARGIRAGTRVEQGQIIGYVGMTGLANGPHVHYEFLKNGRHLNPRRVDLGDGDPVPAGLRAEFDSVRGRFDRLLGRRPADPPSAEAQPVARVD